MSKNPDIKYLNREFLDIKGELVNLAKNYFPETYNDFSPTSPGTMFLEMAAYVGDIISFYSDNQIQETFTHLAKNPANLYTLAYMYGYHPKVTHPSEVLLTVSQTVPAIGPQGEEVPDFTEADMLPGTLSIVANNPSRTQFNLSNSVDFSFSSSLDPTSIEAITENGEVTDFILTKTVKAFSGTTAIATVEVEELERFFTAEIDDEGIIKVLSIVDSDNNEWIEVPYLGQDTTFQEGIITEQGVRKDLLLVKQDRRFVTRFTSTGTLQIQFGAGIKDSGDQESFLPDPRTVGQGLSVTENKFNIFYDPSNFLFTNSYGLAPTPGTTLTITYLTGNGVQDNINAGEIDFSVGNFSITNLEPAQGGRGPESIRELRENITRAFKQQGRIVTLEDYAVRAASLPGDFGVVSKVFPSLAASSSVLSTSNTTVDLYILSEDSEGRLIPPTETLKENLRKYLSQFTPLTQTVNIRDAFVINIGVQIEVLPRPGAGTQQLLAQVIESAQEYFDTSRRSINTPIDLNELYSIIDNKVKGVQTVENVRIFNLAGNIDGREYSGFSYDIQGGLRNNIIYPSLDPSIFEVKFPDQDIKAKIVSV